MSKSLISSVRPSARREGKRAKTVGYLWSCIPPRMRHILSVKIMANVHFCIHGREPSICRFSLRTKSTFPTFISVLTTPATTLGFPTKNFAISSLEFLFLLSFKVKPEVKCVNLAPLPTSLQSGANPAPLLTSLQSAEILKDQLSFRVKVSKEIQLRNI